MILMHLVRVTGSMSVTFTKTDLLELQYGVIINSTLEFH